MAFLELGNQIGPGDFQDTPSHPKTLTPSPLPIDPTALVHPNEPISPLLYSGFIEHLGRCIYGGVVDDPENPSPANLLEKQEKGRLGWRKDVMKVFGDGQLEMKMIRWPGGNFVSNYHWQDGVGPIEERKGRTELAWRTHESNIFGTDEFIDWCRATNIEPMLCLNMGTGTLEEALAWVEYCNGTSNTYWANLRRKHTGRDEPHNIKYWGMGNEIWGPWQVGSQKAAAYSEKCHRWAKALRMLDPSLKLVSCGNTGATDWDREVLMENIDIIDYHSIHFYTFAGSRQNAPIKGLHYEYNVFSPAAPERAIETCKSLIDIANVERSYMKIPARDVRICFDEWGIIDESRCDHYHGHEQIYDFTDLLGFAAWLNVLVRKHYESPIACLAQSVNVIAPIITKPDGLVYQTVYYPLSLFGRYMKDGHLLNLKPMPDTYNGPTYPVWIQQLSLAPRYIDTAAMILREKQSQKASIRLSVLNRHPEAGWKLDIPLINFDVEKVEVHEFYSDDLSATNTFDHPDVIKPKVTTLSGTEWAKQKMEVKKHSWCFFIIDGKVKQ